MKRYIFILVLLLTLPSIALAANVYIGPASSGNASGDSWTNTKAFSTVNGSNWVRGNTYYLKEGSYGSLTFETANSGSTMIYIKKCGSSGQTTNGSGDGVCENAAGFIASQHDGQATFGGFTFQGNSNSAGYLTIDGVTGGGPNNWESGFGIKCTEVSSEMYVDNNSDYITLSHIDINVGATGPSDVRGMTLYGLSNFTLEYSYLHDSGCDLISMNAMNNFTIQYSKLARNHQAEPGCHGDLIEYQIDDASNFVIRWNFFEDIVGTYAFGSHGPTITGYYVYGNIFYFTENCFFGNGMIGCLSSSGTLVNFKFYNNTIAGVIGNGGYGYGFGRLGGSGHEARNNLIYRSSGETTHSWSSTTTSSNTAYNMGSVADQNLSGNPFSSYPSSFALSSNSTAGTSLSSPYNVDMYGNTYANSGTWTRGAVAFGSGGGGDFTAPAVAITTIDGSANSSATYSTSSSTVTLAGTVYDAVGATGVTWANSATGGSGTATCVTCDGTTGTKNWSIASIPLQLGANTITISGRDAIPNTGTDILTVTYETTLPTISTPRTISISGTTLSLPFSEAVTSAITGYGGFTIAPSGGAATLSYASGSGTSTLVYTISRAIQYGETATVSYTAPGAGLVVKDLAGNNLATITNSVLTNNSTQGQVTDPTKPTVSILTPADPYPTASATVNITGVAADNVGVTRVDWINNREGVTRTASCNGCPGNSITWSQNSIALFTGINIITATAYDAAGNSITDTLTVTYTPVVIQPQTIRGLKLSGVTAN